MYKVKCGLDLYLTPFLNYLATNALHTRYGIVTLYYHVLKLYNMASTVLDISGRSYGQNLPKIKEICQVYLFL